MKPKYFERTLHWHTRKMRFSFAFSFAIFAMVIQNSSSLRPSEGCRKNSRGGRSSSIITAQSSSSSSFPFPLSKLNRHHITPPSGDPRLQPLERRWFSYFPKSYSPAPTPIPVLLYFHGQGGNAKADADSGKYVDFVLRSHVARV